MTLIFIFLGFPGIAYLGEEKSAGYLLLENQIKIPDYPRIFEVRGCDAECGCDSGAQSDKHKGLVQRYHMIHIIDNGLLLVGG